MKKLLTLLFAPRAKKTTAGEIAQKFGLELRGLDTTEIRGIAPIADAAPGQLAFYSDERNSAAFKILPIEVLKNTRATVIVVQPHNAKFAPKSATLLITESPRNAIVKIIGEIYGAKTKPGIHPGAHVARGATVHKTAIIEFGAYIGRAAIIGANTRVMPNAYVDNATVGADCVIGPGASVGKDSFGFTRENGKNVFIPHAGRAILHDRVELGANTCIDRGMITDTIVGAGTKIGNLCQAAHGCVIGRECFLAGGIGLAGGVQIGDYVNIGGQVGIANNLKIGDRAEVAAGSMIIRDVAPGTRVMGYPAELATTFLRMHSTLKKQVS